MNMPAGTMLQLSDVYLNFHSRKSTFDAGTHHVLNGVSLDLFEGETLGVIGKNGCGKTTILRLMAGIIAPTAGSVMQRKGTASALLSIGLGFKPNLSGRDNALLSGMLQGASREQAIEFVDRIKEFSELGDSFEEPVKTYSSGMRSRLGFSTALVTHVDILLVDEVLSVGDAQFKAKAEEAITKRLSGEQTVVFVSHSSRQIKNLCDRAIWLHDGKIAGEGDSEQIVDAYQEYIGKNSSHTIRHQDDS